MFDKFSVVSSTGCCSCLVLPSGTDLLPSHHESSSQHDIGDQAQSIQVIDTAVILMLLLQQSCLCENKYKQKT